ncbi:MAG TPA: SpaA isopeptide-forming pilin-related protein, partial [Egibacteraceae bacterium]|nr:SpaA isopeptide-forming pilin-related protein [Egibacteraceae bacterium]
MEATHAMAALGSRASSRTASPGARTTRTTVPPTASGSERAGGPATRGTAGTSATVSTGAGAATGADGVGSCEFPSVPPGDYLVVQTAAPEGHAAAAEPHPVALAAGEARTITFTNASDMSTVEVSATDGAGAPLEGAAFAAYADADSDGTVAPGAAPAATCVTGPGGTCRMRLPAGAYVLVQTAAPAGLEPMDPLAFRFATGGQVAAVTVRNATPAAGAPAPAAAPVYSAPVAAPARSRPARSRP